MSYKSIHTIFYALSYENKYCFKSNIDICEFMEELAYYPQFIDLFNNDKIATYKVEEIKKDNHEKIKTIDSKLFLNLKSKTFELDVNYIKVYQMVEYKTLIIAINASNYESDNFIDLSIHLDKNTSYSVNDEFESIMINDFYISKRHATKVSTANLLNDYFFEGNLENPKLTLGRKNYHMFSIIDERLSDLCKDISKDKNYEIYKIVTCEHVNANVGPKTYQRFLDTVYDKWADTGSLYIVNFTNLVQILPENGRDHSLSFMKTNEKMVVLSLFQKCLFLDFQTIDQKRNDVKSFKKFINNYYYLEISPERQIDRLYQQLQKELKNLEYYEMLTSEIEIYSAAINNRTMFYVTATYTLFALISILIMLWEVR